MANDPMPYPSLTNLSAISAGTPIDGGICRGNHTLVVTTSAGVTAGVVQLQGSLDGATWFNFTNGSVSTTAASTTSYISVANSPARLIRAAITTAITGGTVSAVVGMAD